MRSNCRKFFKSGSLGLLFVLLMVLPALALEANEYRQIIGLDSRKLVWFVGQMHLFFGAFVLGVPLFAVIIEIVGWKNRDKRFDKLAYEFTSLLSVAYATTAALGGLMTFVLITLYPTFMGYMAGVFKDAMIIYALFFFGETACLYLYYYGWDWLKGGSFFDRRVQWVMKGIGGASSCRYYSPGYGAPYAGDTRAFIVSLFFPRRGFSHKDRKSVHICGIMLNT